MQSFEENTLVFILRLWREPREVEGAEPQWRGVIEDVTSDDHQYFQDLDEIAAFIEHHLTN